RFARTRARTGQPAAWRRSLPRQLEQATPSRPSGEGRYRRHDRRTIPPRCDSRYQPIPASGIVDGSQSHFAVGGFAMNPVPTGVAFAILASVVALGQGQNLASAQPFRTQAREVPKFEADASWAKLPSKWVWGQVSSVSIDEDGNAWILQRPSTVRADQKSMAAPPVLKFDAAGNFLLGWGGPGAGYDWPETEHGIYADPKGFIWLGGNGPTDHHLVKFTKDGKFVMQIGRKGQSKGNNDTQNVKQSADTFVHSPTNELFVADGYGNRRIIVF